MDDPAALVRFYERRLHAGARRSRPVRALAGARGARQGRPRDRAVSARGHRGGRGSSKTLEVGCGDGALLCELHRRGFGGALSGVEITRGGRRDRARAPADRLGRAVRRAAPAGRRRRVRARACSHTCSSTSPTLPRCCARSPARAGPCSSRCRSRPTGRRDARGKRAHAAEVGHLQRLDRRRGPGDRRGRGPVDRRASSTTRCRCRCTASSPTRRHSVLAASAKWAARAGLHRLAPALARRGLHACTTRACACRRARSGREQQRQHRCPSARPGPRPGRRASDGRCRRRARRSRPPAARPGSPARGRTRARRRRSARVSTWRICAKRSATFGRTSGSRTP